MSKLGKQVKAFVEQAPTCEYEYFGKQGEWVCGSIAVQTVGGRWYCASHTTSALRGDTRGYGG